MATCEKCGEDCFDKSAEICSKHGTKRVIGCDECYRAALARMSRKQGIRLDIYPED